MELKKKLYFFFGSRDVTIMVSKNQIYINSRYFETDNKKKTKHRKYRKTNLTTSMPIKMTLIPISILFCKIKSMYQAQNNLIKRPYKLQNTNFIEQ